MSPNQSQTVSPDKGWINVRVPVSEKQRAALEKLADEAGVSIATCVRLAATEYVRQAEDASSETHTRASLIATGRSCGEAFHVRLPQQLRRQLLALEARNGLNMHTQLRLAVGKFLDTHEPGGS